jgi:hypothetical protein
MQIYEKIGLQSIVKLNTALTSTPTLLAPSINKLSNGGFVVAWQDALDIRAQLFDVTGSKVGSDFLVNTKTLFGQRDPEIASLTNGGFVITWEDASSPGSNNMTDIKAQIFAANGAAVGNEFLVNNNTFGNQAISRVTGLANGGFVIMWTNYAFNGPVVTAQLFDVNGTEVGNEIVLNQSAVMNGGNSERDTVVAGLSNGGFVAAWADFRGTQSLIVNIVARVFDANGAIGRDVLVDIVTSIPLDGLNVAVTGLTDSRFVVSWTDASGALGDGSETSIKAQIFDGNGLVWGSAFLVNTTTAGKQYDPAITALADGGFVVTWTDLSGTLGDSSGASIKAQAFDASGARVGSEFLVNTATAYDQKESEITGLSNGSFAVTWIDAQSSTNTLNRFHISSQLFGVNMAPPSISSNGAGPSAFISMVENTWSVTTVTADDADFGSTLSYSISGGSDAALFFIDAGTGALWMINFVPNFEAPGDAGANNIYDVIVQVSDGTLTDTQAIAVTVTNANEAPTITSNSGGATAVLSVAENSTAVTTVTATDVDAGASLAYSISGGADAALFAIDAATGALTFRAAPNFEAPGDAGTNNVYDVVVQVSDGTLTDTQAIAVTVTNVDEPPSIVTGTAGDDRFVSQAVNETIAGLAGLDTVVFSGARLDYEISRANGAVTVRDVRAQGDGTDTLTGIERLQFSDGFMGLLPEELLLFLPGTRDLITWDSTLGSNGFTYFFRLNATTNIAAVADLTGDGRADLLLTQPGGGLIRWDPSQGGNGFAVLPEAPGFSVAGIGDLVGNGADDILLRNAAGQLRVLDPASGTINDLFTLAQGWSLKGVANINGSGKDDIVLQNNANGAVIAFTDKGWVDLLTLAPGSGWEIAGLGDVVGGLADDFIFRNSNTGVTIFWDSTAGSSGFRDFATIGQDWSLTTVSDLSGDGRDDVVLETANGLAIYWTGNTWVDLGNVLAGSDMIGTGLFL